jgi:hypothetical protein
VNIQGSLVESSEAREEMRSERDEVLERVLRQRNHHRERSVFARAGVVVAGGAVSVFAALLTVTAHFAADIMLHVIAPAVA